MVTRLNYGQRVLAEQMSPLGLFIDVSREPLYARIRNTMVLICAIECIKTRERRMLTILFKGGRASAAGPGPDQIKSDRP